MSLWKFRACVGGFVRFHTVDADQASAPDEDALDDFVKEIARDGA